MPCGTSSSFRCELKMKPGCIAVIQTFLLKMTKKERKIKCRRCGRHILATELGAHFTTHKGKLYKKKVRTQAPKQAKKAKALKELIKRTETYPESNRAMPQCSICSEYSRLLMPYENVMLCPTCSLDYFESKKILGIPVSWICLCFYFYIPGIMDI